MSLVSGMVGWSCAWSSLWPCSCVAMCVSLASGRLQPVLIDLDVDRVVRRAGIVGPDVALAKAHAVERLRRQARPVIGQLLGIGEGSAKPFDDAAAATDVPGGAQMARHVGASH